ncbi:MAG: hypothetical protein HQL91_00090 [Magnetococcales bacterium]|nr:hypothetical protein [Magnetococcales bacterium]
MLHGSRGSRSTESLARVGTFFVATRADWQAWLDNVGAETPERVMAPEKRIGRSWGMRRNPASGGMG